MRKEDLDAIATRAAHCKPYGASVTLSIGERDDLVALARDGMRYRWLTEDHADLETREHRNGILRRMTVMSHSAASADIDSAIAAQQGEGG